MNRLEIMVGLLRAIRGDFAEDLSAVPGATDAFDNLLDVLGANNADR